MWVVDQNNGPGTQFTDLPPAVANATSGDTIIERSGLYSAAAITDKALTIRGIGPTSCIVGASLEAALTIVDQPAGTTDAAGHIATSLPPSLLGTLLGMTLHLQAGTFDFGLGRFRVSNGAVASFGL